MPANQMRADYRHSHLEKGDAYHSEFERDAFRRITWNWERRVLNEIVSQLDASGRRRYLDVACGTGRIIAHLENAFTESTGVDISASMLEVARRTLKRSRLLHCDITADPGFRAANFDFLTAFRFFPNAQPNLRREVAQRCYELLAPGGYLVFNNHRNDDSSLYRALRLRAALSRRAPPEGGVSTVELVGVLQRAGFEEVQRYAGAVFPSGERLLFLPEVLYRPIDAHLSRIPFLRRYALNHICVLRKPRSG